MPDCINSVFICAFGVGCTAGRKKTGWAEKAHAGDESTEMKHLRIMGLKLLILHGSIMSRYLEKTGRPAAVYARHAWCRHFPEARWCIAPSGAFCLIYGGSGNNIVARRVALGLN
jgi:hypothetical protein